MHPTPKKPKRKITRNTHKKPPLSPSCHCFSLPPRPPETIFISPSLPSLKPSYARQKPHTKSSKERWNFHSHPLFSLTLDFHYTEIPQKLPAGNTLYPLPTVCNFTTVTIAYSSPSPQQLYLLKPPQSTYTKKHTAANQADISEIQPSTASSSLVGEEEAKDR